MSRIDSGQGLPGQPGAGDGRSHVVGIAAAPTDNVESVVADPFELCEAEPPGVGHFGGLGPDHNRDGVRTGGERRRGVQRYADRVEGSGGGITQPDLQLRYEAEYPAGWVPLDVGCSVEAQNALPHDVFPLFPAVVGHAGGRGTEWELGRDREADCFPVLHREAALTPLKAADVDFHDHDQVAVSVDVVLDAGESEARVGGVEPSQVTDSLVLPSCEWHQPYSWLCVGTDECRPVSRWAVAPQALASDWPVPDR